MMYAYPGGDAVKRTLRSITAFWYSPIPPNLHLLLAPIQLDDAPYSCVGVLVLADKLFFGPAHGHLVNIALAILPYWMLT